VQMKPQLRIAKFAFVGSIGIGVQLLVLTALNAAGVHYLIATTIAVEAAILHNFIWHWRFTWADRCAVRERTLARMARFQVSAGLISLVGNVALMAVFRGVLRIPVLFANLLSISVCALLNFALSDRWVFMNTSPAPERLPNES
jgi:putative flippase GtrA